MLYGSYTDLLQKVHPRRSEGESMDINMLKQIRKGEIVAVIPARSGSKGIKDKNLQCINGHPLIAYAITSAKLSSKIGRVIVSTDSDKYAKTAKQYGAEVPFLRPAEISGDTATDLEFMQHILKWLSIHEQKIPEYFVHLRCTYPARDVSVIDKAIEMLVNNSCATSLRSAHKSSFTPYKWFQIDSSGYFQCLTEHMRIDDANNPRQNFPDVFIPDGYVDVLKSEFIIKNDLLHGPKTMAYITPDGIDIDSMSDLERIRNQVDEKHLPLFDYLNLKES